MFLVVSRLGRPLPQLYEVPRVCVRLWLFTRSWRPEGKTWVSQPAFYSLRILWHVGWGVKLPPVLRLFSGCH